MGSQKMKKKKSSSKATSDDQALISNLLTQSHQDTLIEESEDDELVDHAIDEILVSAEEETESSQKKKEKKKKKSTKDSKKKSSKKKKEVDSEPKSSKASSSSSSSSKKVAKVGTTPETSKKEKKITGTKRKSETSLESHATQKKRPKFPQGIHIDAPSYSYKTDFKTIAHDGFFVPRAPFQRLVREVLGELTSATGSDVSYMTKDAAIILQYASEYEITEIFNICYSLATLNDRKSAKLPTFKYAAYIQKLIREGGQFMHCHDKPGIQSIMSSVGKNHLIQDKEHNIDTILSGTSKVPKLFTDEDRRLKKKFSSMKSEGKKKVSSSTSTTKKTKKSKE